MFTPTVVYPHTFWYGWRLRVALWRSKPWYALHLRTASGGGFPDAAGTGPQFGTIFTNTSGELSSTANGQVIKDLNHSGYILIKHSNVTIQDCIITLADVPNQTFAIGYGSGVASGAKILRCRIVGGFALGGIIIDVPMSNIEVGFCDISRCENGITVATNAVNIHDNYIHDLSREPGHVPDPHYDGIQGFPGPYTNWTINHNTIVSRDTSGIISGNEATARNTALTISNNKFLAGDIVSYGIHIRGTDGVSVTNNRFGKFAAYPTYPADFVSVTNLTFTGNVDDATGTPITPSIS